MFRRILAWLGIRNDERVGGDGEGKDRDSADDGTDGGGFTPSRLDASVLEAHGMGSTEAERELASLEEKGRILEDEQPDEHHQHHQHNER